MELYELGICEAQAGLARGDFSSRDLVEAIAARYREKNGEIGAYLAFDEEAALRLAEANPKAVPIAIKDFQPSKFPTHKSSGVKKSKLD